MIVLLLQLFIKNNVASVKALSIGGGGPKISLQIPVAVQVEGWYAEIYRYM